MGTQKQNGARIRITPQTQLALLVLQERILRSSGKKPSYAMLVAESLKLHPAWRKK